MQSKSNTITRICSQIPTSRGRIHLIETYGTSSITGTSGNQFTCTPTNAKLLSPLFYVLLGSALSIG